MSDRSRSPLLEAHRFLGRGPVNAEGWSQLVAKDRDWERSYRGPWAGMAGAAGGLGGFFPPLVMALVKSLTGSYLLGFLLLAAVAVACLLVLMSFARSGAQRAPRAGLGPPGPAVIDR